MCFQALSFKSHIILFSEINIFTYLRTIEQSNLQFRSAGKEKDGFLICGKLQTKYSITLSVDYPAIYHKEILDFIISYKILLIKTCWGKAED